ncbi:MAG: ABC transporter permease [Bryobacterales bacterium]|nr:ABC transporter permease [Bryobacterales bacterium]
METLLRNLKHALRQIRRQPALAGAIILTLGLAIGASTAIFSFVNALLLRPFPFKDPDQLVEIQSIRGGQPGKVSMVEILDMQRELSVIESIAAHKGGAGGYNYSGEGRPEEWRAVLTTGNLFEVLGVSLAAGNKWPPQPDRDRDFRVVLSYGVWQRSFGGRPDVVGKTISLDHAPGYTIHGVAGRGFDFPRGIQVYRSIGGFTNYEKRDVRDVVGIARIRRPAGVAQLQAELNAFSSRLQSAYPDSNAGLTFRAVPFRELYAGDVRPYLWLLLGAVIFVLLIACANVTNLLLSRALSRDREMAVRVAIGAGRWQLLGQLLTESVVLSLSAALFGVGLAYAWMKVLRTLIGFELPEWMVIDLDGRVLLFTAGIGLAAGILSGLAPALQVAGTALAETLKEGGRGGSAGRSSGRLRDAMIIAEVALAVVLLAGAGLLIRGFLHLQSQEKGFDSTAVSTFRVALGWRRYGGERVVRYYEQALQKMSAIPGITEVALDTDPPLARQEETQPATVQREGQSAQEALQNPYVTRHTVSENFFAFARIPIRQGRTFSAFDQQNSEPVAIISERLAKLLWPDGDAVGRRILWNPASNRAPQWRKVVGVAGNVQQRELGGQPGYDYYLPYRQDAGAANQYILARTSLPLAEFTRLSEQAMWSIDPEQSIFDFATWDERILNSIWQLRISRMLLMLFAGVALVLSAIGIYGVMSFLVGQRRREMGIRLALGATPGSVQAIVIRRGATLGGAGMAIGLVLSVLVSRGLFTLVPGMSGIDPASFGLALAIIAAVIISACAVPAWRASSVDPVEALRQS